MNENTKKYQSIVGEMVKNLGLDAEKVWKLVDSMNLSSVRDTERYIKKVIMDKKDSLLRDWKEINFDTLHKAFRDNNFNGDSKLLILIDLIEEHILMEFPIKVEELIKANHDLVETLVKENKTTYTEFGTRLVKTFETKGNIPKKELWAKAIMLDNEYNALINQLEDKEEN